MTRISKLLIIFILSLICSAAAGERKNYPSIKLESDFNYALIFDNREYDPSRLQGSGTLFSARLSPYVGLEVNGCNTEQKLYVGFDVVKDFGDVTSFSGRRLLREVSFWYSYNRRYRNDSEFTMTAGIFPRTIQKEEWSEIFFSREKVWNDHNLEGLLLQWSNRKARIEMGCDWMGMYGATPSTREQFMIYSAGHYSPADFITLGYNAYGMHFACSEEVIGVVDNILAEPYVRFDFQKLTGGVQELSARLGYIQAIQRDRRLSHDFASPSIGELDLKVQNWGFGLENRLYYGGDMMPFYTTYDNGGIMYGDRLYFGNPFFRMTEDSSGTKNTVYDCVEAYWSKRIGTGLDLKFSALFHFNDKYSGCQQVFSLIFDLGSFQKKR